jgi:erythronate-4-phosphate dehydrogenase
MKIVADINIPYIKGVLEPYAEVVCLKGSAIGPADVRDADALLVRTRTRCDAALLAGSKVRFIGTATIGYDHIDTQWCRANGIEVAVAAGSNAGGVLQWISAALVLLSAESNRRPEELTLGVVGVGHVGSLVAGYARQWGFRVVCSDPPREQVEGLGRGDGFLPFGELAAVSDIVTFHVPLLREGPHKTLEMGDKRFFGMLKQGATVINTSRGGVVVEAELSGAISRGRCLGCIDTWAGEPRIDRLLLDRAFIATPHIAGYSAQGKANASAMIVEALAGHFSLPISGWYPAEVSPAARRPVSWEELTATVAVYCDLAGETALLKQSPDLFESMRENYAYRQEYF